MQFLYLFYIIIAFAGVDEKKRPRLVWADEFNYEGLPDSTRWEYQIGDGCPLICGWGNNELQYYMKATMKNARVTGGKLIIEAHKEQMQKMNYTSARLRTVEKATWKYGFIEIRAKLPSGRGTWPAIWMLPQEFKYGGWPASGEIDIMEHVGYDPGVIHGTVHTGAFNHIKGTQVGKQDTIADYNTAFHTYGVNWTKDAIEFYIDGKQYHVFSNNGNGTDAWPFDQPFYLIMNIAIGGGWGGKYGVDDSIFPQRMEIDYVRVYEPLQTEKQKIALRNWQR